jgi:hypothetical protein
VRDIHANPSRTQIQQCGVGSVRAFIYEHVRYEESDQLAEARNEFLPLFLLKCGWGQGFLKLKGVVQAH